MLCRGVLFAMAWSNEKTLNLIKLFEERPILWQKGHSLYYNQIKKEDAWSEIGVIIKEDVSIIKKKIESLRGSRRREKTRLTKSKGTGKGKKYILKNKILFNIVNTLYL